MSEQFILCGIVKDEKGQYYCPYCDFPYCDYAFSDYAFSDEETD